MWMVIPTVTWTEVEILNSNIVLQKLEWAFTFQPSNDS